MVNRQHVRVVLAAAAAAGLLAGCASSSGGATGTASALKGSSSDVLAADPLTAVRDAADITGRTGSVQDVTSLQTASQTKKQTLHGTAVYDYTTRLGRVEVTVPPGGPTKGRLVEVVSPGVVYMQNSGAKVPAGKWVKVDVQQLADGNLVSSGATDPATAANALRGAATAVLLGSQTVDGVLLKHYKGTLDLAKAASATGGGAAAGLALAGRTFTVKQVPYEVWLDQHGRIHRIVETFTFSKVANSTAAKDQVVVTSSNAFSGFGAPVTVALPPAADVYGAQTAK
ncbi:hypothetical protein ACEZCY_09460 [Streptacidiphilus sp. N1-12]|uniref:Lipoprotein n=2 Tax=Streptacidiphilus alkalitolerans TaxID=3342712 RepID=A0ABV6X6Q9_9ACTN